jgi:hypothetical protein
MDNTIDYFHLAVANVQKDAAAFKAFHKGPLEPAPLTNLSITEIRVRLSIAHPDIWLLIQHLSGSLEPEVWHAFAHLLGRAETQIALTPEDLKHV